MRNVDMTVDNNILIIKVDLNAETEVSKSGKSLTIGTTKGNVSVPGHKEIKVGLNVYKKNENPPVPAPDADAFA